MRNLKKLLAVVVVICIIATMAIPAFAAGSFTYEAQAKNLYDMKLFLGNSGTSYVPDLGSSLTREQGIILLVRLFGKEADAKALTDADKVLAGYTDAAKVSSWAKNYVAYAVKTQMVYGATTTTIDPQGKLVGNAVATIILRALGYEVTGSAYGTACATLQTKGGNLTAVEAAAFSYKELIRDDACGIMYNALLAKDSTGKILIEKLVAAGVVTEAAATAAGLYNVAINTVAMTGIKTVKVTFNRAVDTTKAVVKIKKGAAIYYSTLAWDTTKTIATLTTVATLPAGDYSVEVTGLSTTALTKAFSATAEAATTVAITSTTLDDATAAAKVNFAVKNQYGEDMAVYSNTLGVVASAYNVTQNAPILSAALVTSANKYYTIDTSAVADTYKVGDVIRFTITYSGITAQANLTVQTPSNASTISLGNIVLASDDTRLNVADGTVKLNYTMADQYGVASYLDPTLKTALSTTPTFNGVQFISSNTAVISHIQIVDNSDGNGEIVLTVAGAGTAVITAVIPASGSTTSTAITVNANATPTTAVIAPPTALVAGNDDTFYLPVTVTDAYGDAYKSTTGLTISATSGAAAIGAPALVMVNGEVKIAVTPNSPASSTSVTLTLANATTNLTTVTFSVEPDAVATQVIGYSGPTSFEAGSNYTVTADDFTVLDQYGREIAANAVVVTEDTDSSNIMTVLANNVAFNSTTGTAIITATVDGVAYDVTLTSVASSAVVSYALDTIGTIYSKATFTSAAAAGDYATKLVLVGKDAAGKTVNLIAGKINNVTVSDSAVLGTEKVGSDYVVYGNSDTAGTATVRVWNNATKLAEISVKTSVATPVPTNYSFENATATATQLVTITDQYGVTDTDASGKYYSSDTDVATVDVTSGVVTAGATSGSATITYVTKYGTTVTYTFIN